MIKFSLISFLLLFLFLYHIDAEHKEQITTIDKITAGDINKNVKIIATIKKQNLKKEIMFLKLKDNTSSIKAVAFDMNTTLNENHKYIVEGKITLYKKEIEIMINSIKTLKHSNLFE